MNIYIGADHGGFELKKKIKEWLTVQGHFVEDIGAVELDPQDDYPQYAFAVARGVLHNGGVGILVCRSGGGMTIAANRVPGIRAVDCMTVESAVHARTNNNANVLSLSGDWVDETLAIEIVHAFLTTQFLNEERHVRRISQLDQVK